MEPSSSGPVVERALLTAELRRLRAASGERQKEVADACEWSLSKFTRIENGASSITRADLEALLRHYDVTDSARVSQLTDRARAARQKGWWQEFNISDKAFDAYLGYEAGASTLRMFAGLLVPGLLQTPAYTKAILAAYRISSDDTEVALRIRRQRQRRMAERASNQTYIIDEAALTRPANGAMPQQLRHLVQLAGKPAVTIRVIPFSRGPHFGLKGPFILLGFDAALDDVLYMESARGGDTLITGGSDQIYGPGVTAVPNPGEMVADYEEGYNSLMELALDPDESLKFLERIIQDVS